MNQDKNEKILRIKSGDTFHSTCSISDKELEEYLNFSRVRNAFLEERQNDEQIVSGRAILSRMEGEFTRLSQIYGNHLIFLGMDGDPNWENRNTRFLKPLYTDQVLKLKFTISQLEEIDDEFGKIIVDYEATDNDGETIVLSKRNIYRIKREPPRK